MSGLIMNSLELAAQSGVQATQVDFKGAKVELENVKFPQFLRGGQIYRKFALFKGRDMNKLHFNLSFKHPRNDYEEESFETYCSTSKVIKSDDLFKLAASAYCKEH